jgi:S1-C subfamily serine protease
MVGGSLAVAIGAGLGYVAPAVYGQSTPAPQVERNEQRRTFGWALERGSEIGIAVRDLDDADVTRQKLPARQGAVVERVQEDSPAAAAGLRTGDVVTTFDGEKVRSARQLSRLVEETPPGRAVAATIVRDGATQTVDITPRAEHDRRFGWRGVPPDWMPGPQVRVVPEPPEIQIPELPDLSGLDRLSDLGIEIERGLGQGPLGVTVQTLTKELAEYFGAGGSGVLVSSVRDESPAAKAGIKVGDVITTADGTAVKTAGELRRRVRDSEREILSLGLVREKKTLSLDVRIERPARRTIMTRRWSA